MSYWFRSGLYSFFDKGASLLFGFGGLLILLRYLSVTEMGIWVLFLSVGSFFEVSRVGFLQNPVIKYLSGADEQEYSRITSAALCINIVLSLSILVLLILLAGLLGQIWDAPEFGKLLPIFGLTTLSLSLFHHANFISQSNLDFKSTFWSGLVRKGLFFILLCLLFFLGWDFSLIDLAFAQVVIGVLASLTAIWLSRPYLRHQRKVDFSWVSRLFHFGKYVFGVNLNAILYKLIDKMMLGALVSKPAVSLYELAIRITNLAEVPSFSIAHVVFPKSARYGNQNDLGAIRLLYERSVGAILAILLPVITLVLLFPEHIVWLVGGEKYTESTQLLQLTILYGLFIPFAIQFGTALDSMGRPKLNLIFTIVGNVINVIVNYLFISRFGLVGAAYGTLSTYFLTFILQQILLHRLLEVKFWKVFFFIIPFYKILLQKLGNRKEK